MSYRSLLKAVIVVLGTAGLLLVIASIINPHTVRGYYIHFNPGLFDAREPYCLYADIDWELDERVYCANDLNSVGMMLVNMRRIQEGSTRELPQVDPGKITN